jgi:hypothetical protein
MRYASRVFAAAVFAALLVACLGCGSAKADVTFAFYFSGDPSDELLALTMPEEPSSKYRIQYVLSGGEFIEVEYATDYAGDPYALILSAPVSGLDSEIEFTTTSTPPGDGDFPVRGTLGPYDVGSVTVSGVPVGAAAIPEPSTWAMMLLGFAGLGYAGCRGRKVRRCSPSGDGRPRGHRQCRWYAPNTKRLVRG